MSVAHGVCVGDWDRLYANVLPRATGRPVIAICGQTSIATAYNAILDAAREINVDLLILQHDDLEIVDPDVEAKLLAAVDAGAGVVGVAGGMYRGDIAWWVHEPVGHQQTDAMLIDFGPRAGTVDLLEGSLLALPRYVLESRLRFDERYPGFHGYDVDISRQVQRVLGLDVVVVDLDTHHHNRMGYKSQESYQDWLTSDRLFREKWGQP